MARKNKIHPESKVELNPVIARNYDQIMNTITFGKYKRFIRRAVKEMDIRKDDHVLDLGCGTGKNAGLIAEYLGHMGKVTGIDVSEVMQDQFQKKHGQNEQMEFILQRIDVPFDLGRKYDKVLISFVIHGLPHDFRKTLIENARKHLKPGGKLIILDFAEFDMASMPVHHRFIFRTVECKYAFDFIGRDWKGILAESGYKEFEETLFFNKYARLLTALSA